MAIDFRLTARQRELQLQSRKFARQVLSGAAKAEILATPEERFAATKPAYEAMIAAGFLRRYIPLSAGGDNTSLLDTAIMIEELYAGCSGRSPLRGPSRGWGREYRRLRVLS